MFKQKYLIPLFYIIITMAYLIIVSNLILSTSSNDFVPFIIGGALTDILYLFIGVPIIMCIPLIFIKGLTKIHYKIMKRFQRNYEFYYHVYLSERLFKGRKMVSRAVLPVLLTLSFSMLFNNYIIIQKLFGPEKVISIIMLSIFLAPFTSLIFLPIWVFKDSGVLRLLKRSKERVPPEVTFFGKIEYQYYKGFAGITTPILYVITIASEWSLSFNPTFLIILLYPLFLIGLYMPLILIYESKIEQFGNDLIRSLNLEPLKLEVLEKIIL